MKKLVLTIICALTAMTLSAQNNWFVSAGAGAQIYFGDHDKQASFGKRLAPNLDIAVGKWFSPVFGARLMYSGLQVKGATQSGIYTTGEVLGGIEKGWTSRQKFNLMNLHADALFNMSSVFCGTDESHLWNCSPYIGIGVAHIMDSPTTSKVSGNLGLFNAFNVCKAIDINLDIRSMFVSDKFDGERGGRKGEAMLSLSVGVSYKFGGRK